MKYPHIELHHAKKPGRPSVWWAKVHTGPHSYTETSRCNFIGMVWVYVYKRFPELRP